MVKLPLPVGREKSELYAGESSAPARIKFSRASVLSPQSSHVPELTPFSAEKTTTLSSEDRVTQYGGFYFNTARDIPRTSSSNKIKLTQK